jgi:DNA polymerase-3 subunit epsilon
VKDLAPVYNRQLRRHAALVSIRWSGEADGIPEIVGGGDIAGDGLEHLYGLFRSKSQAKKALLGLAEQHRLCLRLVGLEKPAPGACFRHQVGKCGGACGGHEPLFAHHARLAVALARLKLVTWPWSGAIGIREQQPDGGLEELHVVDRWCYLGTFSSEDALREREPFTRRPAFDMDTYKLLLKHLMRGRRPRITPLDALRPAGRRPAPATRRSAAGR